MSDVKITIYDDGPIEVEGPVTVVDENGGEVKFEMGDSIFFCRCGNSADKPFCDGSHHDCKFAHKLTS